MKIYIGNFKNSESILKEISLHDVEPNHGHMQLDSTNPFYSESINQTKMLSDAGYNDAVVEYRHYQSGIHFDIKYTQEIANIVEATPLMCWVSEIRPGKCTPWHWDINPWEKDHEKLGTIVRYFCFLSKPHPGHIFVTEDDAYYNEEQGSIYRYSHIHAWHAGSNVGLKPKYLLTLTAYQ